MNQKIVDPKLCPLCNKLNSCESAADKSAINCWCKEVVFSESLLGRVAEPFRMKTCICRACAEGQKLRSLG